MFATLLAVLALAGAPASTKVECNPELPPSVVLGLTVSDEATIVNGHVVFGRLDHVELGPIACGAILYTSASPSERAAIRRLNPAVNFDQLVGVGLQIVLHEAEHVAMNSADECQVEKVTRSKVDGLIARLADPGHSGASESAAKASDAALPSLYHGC